VPEQTITVSELAELQRVQEELYESGKLLVRCYSCGGLLPMKDALDSSDGRYWHKWCDWSLRYEAAQNYYDLGLRQFQCFLEGGDQFGPFGLDDCWTYMEVVAILVGVESVRGD
jgi:hypothetical protein